MKKKLTLKQMNKIIHSLLKGEPKVTEEAMVKILNKARFVKKERG